MKMVLIYWCNMSNLSSRPAVTAVNLVDLLYIVQGGISKKMTVEQLKDKISEYVLAGIAVQDESVAVGSANILNFVGSAVSATYLDGKATITIAANTAIQFKSLGVDAGTSGSVTSFDTYPGIALDRTSNAVTIAKREVIVTDATTARSLTTADGGKYIRFTSGSNVTYTFVTTPSIPIGTTITIRQAGAGRVTITGSGATVTAYGGTARTLGQHATIYATKVATDTWDVYGQVG